ncbi:MAG TPA: alkaline phosphatase family protein, partial [Gaiellaceae bacterium]|nr:alkaline phosphatase family protein [Gaiellaceae bacterium]
MKRVALAALAAASLAGLLGWVAAAQPQTPSVRAASSPPRGAARFTGIHKIRHVVVIMQENRSFDSYFGTYPGADGIPMKNGEPTVCVPDPATGVCVKPWHDHADRNAGGPHDHVDAVKDIDGGRMDGFIRQAREGRFVDCGAHPDWPTCSLAPKAPDVMGYHDWHEIPNYWAYARNFVLQDHMFESDTSWSLPAHLYLVSGWSARCTKRDVPASCHSAVQAPGGPPRTIYNRSSVAPDYAWTDLTYLLHEHHVSWRYYVAKGWEPDCDDNHMFCAPVRQDAQTPGIWNPLPYFDTVRHDKQLVDIASLHEFVAAAKKGDLPAVSWITPSQAVSDHPPARVTRGQAYVTALIDDVMRSKDWKST